jgi:hypothetical protein
MEIKNEIHAELKPITVSLGNLLLDPNNLRLADTLPEQSDEQIESLQDETLKKILQGYGVQDLESSIINHGWLDVDQIVVRKLRTPQTPESPKFVVVEGNRRIAALINLVSDFKERQIELPSNIEFASKSLRVMLIEGTDEEIDRTAEVIMGIRHIGGPRKWGGLQAAMMVVRIVDEQNCPLNEAGKRLGISSIEAGRRYRSYKAYMQAFENGYKNPNLFTLLGEAIRNKSLREWLSWNDEKNRFENNETLELVYEKLGLKDSDSNDEEKNLLQGERITNPQSMRDLKYIIEHPIAQKIFSETHSIKKARSVISQDERTEKNPLISLCESLISELEKDDLSTISPQEIERLLRLSEMIFDKFGGDQ